MISAKHTRLWAIIFLACFMFFCGFQISAAADPVTASNESANEDILKQIKELRLELDTLRAEIKSMKDEIAKLKSASLDSSRQTTSSQQSSAKPEIEIVEVPPRGEYPKKGNISGKARNIADIEAYKVVIYAETDQWYVQPYVAAPLTEIANDGSWGAQIFLGYRYGLLLVRKSYQPDAKIMALPKVGGDVIAVKTISAKE
jgi:cell division protein FtsB